MPASQDYRDGATQGAQILYARLRSISLMGVQLNDVVMAAVCDELGSEFGGSRLSDGELRENVERPTDG